MIAGNALLGIFAKAATSLTSTSLAPIISVPERNKESVSDGVSGYYGYAELMGKRPSQEDALLICPIHDEMVMPEGESIPLSLTEIAHRMWTSLRILDQSAKGIAGSTATVCYYDGKEHFVTATLADSASFATIHGTEGQILAVKRLNSVQHKPTDLSEANRIEAADGIVIGKWVCMEESRLAVSRALGDKEFGKVVCADASIDITSKTKIISSSGIKPEEVGFIRLLQCCDGYHEPMPDWQASGAESEALAQEQYLLNDLKEIESQYGSKASEQVVSEKLTQLALSARSGDNISVLVARTDKPILVAVFDGHGGSEVSTLAAQNMASVFVGQCAMTRKDYAAQTNSVDNNADVFLRDNSSLPEQEAEALAKPESTSESLSL